MNQRAHICVICGILLLACLGCESFPNRLQHRTIRTPALPTPASYAVWTPNDFHDDERLPVVVFLHGGGDDHRSFDRHGVGQALDDALAAGEIPRVVIVLPQGDNGFWQNWHDGSRYYRDWVLLDVLPRVQHRYHTQRCPEGCHLMGVSMGGAGSVRFMLTRGDMFASAAILSAPIFDSTLMLRFVRDRLFNIFIPTHRIFGQPTSEEQVRLADPFAQWNRPEDVPFRLYLAWADRDRPGLGETNLRLREHLETREIPFQWEEFEGGHNWVSWTPVIIRALASNVGAQ